jgi:hypothetical protein
MIKEEYYLIEENPLWQKSRRVFRRQDYTVMDIWCVWTKDPQNHYHNGYFWQQREPLTHEEQFWLKCSSYIGRGPFDSLESLLEYAFATVPSWNDSERIYLGTLI